MLVPISWHLLSCSFSLKFNKKQNFTLRSAIVDNVKSPQ